MSWFGEAARGEGRLVFVGGEAGAGKSALMAEFCASFSGRVPIYWGECEPLSAPRPLGPIADMADGLGGEISHLLALGDRAGVFDAILKQVLLDPSPKVMVIEGAHWADESTFDFLQFLARRIRSGPVLALVTFRDDNAAHRGPCVCSRVTWPPLELCAA